MPLARARRRLAGVGTDFRQDLRQPPSRRLGPGSAWPPGLGPGPGRAPRAMFHV